MSTNGEPHGQIVKAFRSYGRFDGAMDYRGGGDVYHGRIAARQFRWTLNKRNRVKWHATMIERDLSWGINSGSMWWRVQAALRSDFPLLIIGRTKFKAWVELADWNRAELHLRSEPDKDRPTTLRSADGALVRLCCEFGLTGEPSPPFLDLLQDTFPELQPVFARAECTK